MMQKIYIAFTTVVIAGFAMAWYYGYSIGDSLFAGEVERGHSGTTGNYFFHK